MSKEEGLLEVLTHQVGANYISDLRKNSFHESLISVIENLESSAYSVKEWCDVLDYLSGKKLEIGSPQEGKKALIQALEEA
ncbi:hypothetical protein HGO97_019285 [Faecalicatena sp. AGMB00832]|uniref:Uncharacterized protein n=1 Tax=Faecalicatena faecalis TaxID=2726362 RepID=A0ABS6D8L7_9FIRM|nr:hypothetical protein [Faecalicatena faecalis]MBU3877950.1 hypothetical protein [Faecalicatena faecalis]